MVALLTDLSHLAPKKKNNKKKKANKPKPVDTDKDDTQLPENGDASDEPETPALVNFSVIFCAIYVGSDIH